MHEPKRVKYKKVFGPHVKKRGRELKYVMPVFGIYGLRAERNGIVSAGELKAARLTIRKELKKKAVIWGGVFPNRSVTSKPAEVRMGKGKGVHARWVC